MPGPQGYPNIAPYSTAGLNALLASLARNKTAQEMQARRLMFQGIGDLGGAFAQQQQRKDILADKDTQREHEKGMQRVREGGASARYEAGQDRMDQRSARANTAAYELSQTQDRREASRQQAEVAKAKAKAAAKAEDDAADKRAKAADDAVRDAKWLAKHKLALEDAQRTKTRDHVHDANRDRAYATALRKEVAGRKDKAQSVAVNKALATMTADEKQTKHILVEMGKLEKLMATKQIADPSALPALEQKYGDLQRQYGEARARWMAGRKALRDAHGSQGVNFDPRPDITLAPPQNDPILDGIAEGG